MPLGVKKADISICFLACYLKEKGKFGNISVSQETRNRCWLKANAAASFATRMITVL